MTSRESPLSTDQPAAGAVPADQVVVYARRCQQLGWARAWTAFAVAEHDSVAPSNRMAARPRADLVQAGLEASWPPSGGGRCMDSVDGNSRGWAAVAQAELFMSSLVRMGCSAQHAAVFSGALEHVALAPM